MMCGQPSVKGPYKGRLIFLSVSKAAPSPQRRRSPFIVLHQVYKILKACVVRCRGSLEEGAEL